jgi:glutathione synthase/RimK-type ligase-like ATP-grasp enzyme
MLSANSCRAQLFFFQGTMKIRNPDHRGRCEKKGHKKASDDSMNPKGTRVLIVEDDPFVAMAAIMMVEELGTVVAGTAHSLDAAKEKMGAIARCSTSI